jgi:uncharacterized protein (UPF0276 family)
MNGAPATDLRNGPIPPQAGVGLKPQHYRDILDNAPDIGWFEVHPENYMGDGGAPHHYLHAVRERYPLSLHGVGLSVGGAGHLDQEHLARLKRLIERYEPALFSEYLAWSSHESVYLNDLLPLPYTEETLQRVSDPIDKVQEVVGCREVAGPVWALYARVLARTGPKPTLVEWDNDVPDWAVLFAEAKRADAIIAGRRTNHAAHC